MTQFEDFINAIPHGRYDEFRKRVVAACGVSDGLWRMWKTGTPVKTRKTEKPSTASPSTCSARRCSPKNHKQSFTNSKSTTTWTNQQQHSHATTATIAASSSEEAAICRPIAAGPASPFRPTSHYQPATSIANRPCSRKEVRNDRNFQNDRSGSHG